MTDDQPSLDLDAISTASAAEFELLAEVMTQFSAAFDEWAGNGRRLTSATLDRVKSLSDASDDTLRVLSVKVLVDELAQMPDPRDLLAPRVNAMLRAFLKALLDLARQIGQMMSRLIADGGALNDLTGVFAELQAAFLAEADPDSVRAGDTRDLDGAVARAKVLVAEAMAPVEFYRVSMATVILTTEEVARTLQLAAVLLTDRLNDLVDFLDRTELPALEPVPVRDRFVRIFLKVGVSEAAIETLKSVAEAGLEEVAKEIAKPLTFGLSVVFGIGQKVREKRKALDEQRRHREEKRKLQEEVREAKTGPGGSGYMWILAERFHESLNDIVELLALIEDATMRLRAGLEMNSPDKPEPDQPAENLPDI